MKYLYLLALTILLNLSFSFAQTIDGTFQAPLPIRAAKIQCIKVLPDGKMLLGGDIAFYKNTRVHNLVRLNADGSLDETFNFTLNGAFLVKKIECQNTGDIIILTQGYESLINMYLSNNSLIRLGSDGAIKKEIDTILNANSIALQNDDKILVCGGNYSQNGYLYRDRKSTRLNSSH